MFLGGPPLVKMATGEESDDESLGGAEMHARTSGLADYLAVDEHDAIRIGRRIVARLNWRKRGVYARPRDQRETLTPSRRRPRGAARPDPDRPQGAVRPARGDRPDLRRHGPATRASTSSSRSTARRWSPAGRGCTATRSASSPTPRACCSARRRRRRRSSSSSPTRSTPAALPAQHHRLHGRHGLRAGRHHQARRADDQRGLQQHGAAPLDHHGRVVRRRATTACAAAPTTRASCSPGPARSPR